MGKFWRKIVNVSFRVFHPYLMLRSAWYYLWLLLLACWDRFVHMFAPSSRRTTSQPKQAAPPAPPLPPTAIPQQPQ